MLAAAIALGLTATTAHAQAPTQLPPAAYRDFSGGYVDNVDPVNLKPNESPDMLNVVVDDPIGSVRPRKGYRLCGTLPSGNVATMLYEYTRSDGTRRLIATDNQTVYSTPDCQAWTTIVSGMSAAQQVYFATVRDKLWIVNGSTWPATWDGTSYTLLDGRANTPNPAPPKCSFVEFWKERVWCGAPSGDPSGVAFSALTDTSGNDLDPSTGTASWPASNVFEIDQNAGSRVYGIKAYRNRLYPFKDNGVWEIGFDNDFQNFVRKTYATVGSRYQTSIREADGILYFTGRDGIYAFDGDNSVRISAKIDNRFKALNQPLISQNYKTWATLADFNAGTYSSTTYDNAQVTVSTRQAYIDNGTFETGTLSSWTPVADNTADSYVSITSTGAGSTWASRAGTYQAHLHGNTGLGSVGLYLFDVSGSTLTTSNTAELPGSNSATWDISAYRTQVVRMKISLIQQTSESLVAELWSSTFTAGSQVTFDYYWSQIGDYYLDNVQSFQFYSTGTWTSEIYNTVNVSTWGAFTATDDTNGGNILYEIRYGTDTGATQSMAFRTITSGALIPAATDQVRIQLRATLTASTDLKTAPQIGPLQIAWNNGGANTQKIYAGEWLNALWVSASSGTASTNNLVLRRAKAPLDAWMPMSLQLGPMARYNDNFYAASSTSAAIWHLEVGTNDNGDAISWYWQSRDENWGAPNNAKYLSEVDADYRNDASCNIRIGYVQDQNTQYCVGTAPSPNAALATGIGSRRLNFNGGPAYTYRFKVCDDTKDQAPTITGLTGIGRAIPRRGD